MHADYFHKIASELNIQSKQVAATITLLDEGGTVPFISRYRKEVTGSLDEVAITQIRDRIIQLRELDKRKAAILKSLQEQEKLTPELQKKIEDVETMAVLEDIYLPYKPKRRTKATVAREKGLEPLAKLIFDQVAGSVVKEAENFVNPTAGVNNVDEALQGARDIVAEWINEEPEARSRIRDLFIRKGVFKSKVIAGKEEEGQKFKDYFDLEEPIAKAPSHRVLAMRRGEKESILMLDTAPPEEDSLSVLQDHFVKGTNEAAKQVEVAIKDSYRRLLKPSIETDVRISTKKKADDDAIGVFASNLRQLLLSAPLGQKNVMALDPGFRTGCKLVCLDKQGKLLHFEAIYPNEPQKKVKESGALVKYFCEKFDIEAIAIGNGTASRETESFIESLALPKHITTVMVNESGASIYSASDIAREEFPDQDVTVRGAVSIGRRLMDPLAELVKLDPKSIGVGQYQHDVDQTALKQSLDDVVMSCVNAVGVEVNLASRQLLTYVSGLGPQLAQNIVIYRNENGPFKDREALRKVPRLGDKAFEQAAGFLRISDAVNPLDRSAVHPERYQTVENIAKDLNCSVDELIAQDVLRSKVDLKKYVNQDIGLPTLTDIMQELAKPGRDPREKFEIFSFMEGVNHMEDLTVGMKLPGIVTNITNFGAFVDIGVHQDGLVHVSHVSDQFVSNPATILSVQQKVEVTVLEVDAARKRISLSLKKDPFSAEKPRDKNLGVGKSSPSHLNKTKEKPRNNAKPIQEKMPSKKKQEDPQDMQKMLEMLKGKFR